MGEFTYTPGGTATIDRVRFAIGDSKENTGLVTGGNGPRPDKTNYDDREINQVFADKGSINATIGVMFETLAAEWSAWAMKQDQDKIRIESELVAVEFKKRADEFKAKPDGGGVIPFVFEVA